jgi:hypothetical protein
MQRSTFAGAVLALLVLCCWSLAATAAEITVSWAHPTTRVDGTTLPLGSIANTRIEYAPCASGSTFPATGAQSTLALPAVTNTRITVPAGRYCLRGYTIDTAGVSSAATNVATVTALDAAPNPPGSFTAQPVVVATAAYKLRQTVDGFSFVQIGTVPLGTVCSAEHAAGPYRVIPRASITPRSRVEPLPLMVFAECA